MRHTGDDQERVVLDLHTLLLRHVLQPLDDGVRPQSPEVEPLQPAQDRCSRIGDLLRLGGGEHEYHAGRRLLQNLEERVPRLPREHVRLVDDVDLEPVRRACGVHRPLAQIAGVVHAAVARGIDLDHVQVGGPGPDASAGLTLAARLARVPPFTASVGAVEGHRQDSRRAGLADSARAGQQIGVRNPVLGDRASEPRSHVGLRDEIRKAGGSVLPGECGMDHNG